jgi:hypothetical protein
MEEQERIPFLFSTSWSGSYGDLTYFGYVFLKHAAFVVGIHRTVNIIAFTWIPYLDFSLLSWTDGPVIRSVTLE